MKVHIPTPLRYYTGGRSSVEARGETLADLFRDLDRGYPGMRFRVIDEQDQIRQHIKVFVNQQVADDLSFQLRDEDTVRIIMAISGG